MKKINEIIKGERIELRLLKPTFEMAEIIFKIMKKERDFLLPWLTWYKKNKMETLEKVFIYLHDRYNRNKAKSRFDYGIWKENNFIGYIGIVGIKNHDLCGEMEFWLKKKGTGNGIMNDAIKLLETEFFSGCGLNRIEAFCEPKNISSNNVVKKLGYNFEGKIREKYFSEIENKFITYNQYAKLRSDWETK